jgi:hypothetical protein
LVISKQDVIGFFITNKEASSEKWLTKQEISPFEFIEEARQMQNPIKIPNVFQNNIVDQTIATPQSTTTTLFHDRSKHKSNKEYDKLFLRFETNVSSCI